MAFSRVHRQRVSPKLCPPPPGALKLNFDGSANGNPGLAGIGVLSIMEKEPSFFPIWIQQVFVRFTKPNVTKLEVEFSLRRGELMQDRSMMHGSTSLWA